MSSVGQPCGHASQQPPDQSSPAQSRGHRCDRGLVTASTSGRTLGFLGEPRVNVVELNAAVAAQD
ncbi:MAG: Potassium-transporting ATPase C chain [uncultured Friedmanniella sp.]|uniref:Potassium-transporting ATPase C chain n=1 Tax=uncultured Friedmanniella sp. TaxID=335381 RepID=A0A6J4LPK9_9ACTN|nr:MAG: Potassium-transporting ATPase C chain [uncultured Friedmanniella sp.]